MIHEPAVTLTDYILAIEGALFAWILIKDGALTDPFGKWSVRFFIAFSLVAASGGTVHGFFPDEMSLGYEILWSFTLICLGGAALSGWRLGAALILSAGWQKPVAILAIADFIIYSAMILFVSQEYLLGILNYLPASCFVLFAFGWVAVRQSSRPAYIGVGGLLLTFVAAGVQTAGIGLHPVFFDHNALYHLIQGVAILMIFLAMRGLLRTSAQNA